MELCIKTPLLYLYISIAERFNPCFNGTMYKNAISIIGENIATFCFNPCFNGTMYKNSVFGLALTLGLVVSILVLMELCIKTGLNSLFISFFLLFQSLF